MHLTEFLCGLDSCRRLSVKNFDAAVDSRDASHAPNHRRRAAKGIVKCWNVADDTEVATLFSELSERSVYGPVAQGESRLVVSRRRIRFAMQAPKASVQSALVLICSTNC